MIKSISYESRTEKLSKIKNKLILELKENIF